MTRRNMRTANLRAKIYLSTRTKVQTDTTGQKNCEKNKKINKIKLRHSNKK
jgi:hypothetical protein